MSITPTKASYENALDVVERYEKRQKDLEKLNNDLGHHLKQFDKFQFDVNEENKEITFTGVTKSGDLKLTKSVAREDDSFESVIGKLICVLKALGKDIGYVEKYIEKEPTFKIGSSISLGTGANIVMGSPDPYMYLPSAIETSFQLHRNFLKR